MKLNKREQLAFNTLRNILDAFEQDEELTISNKEQNAVQEVLNINLYEITYRKSQVKEFKRGKDKAHIVLLNRINRGPYPYGYFPFQVKQDKTKQRAEEVEELKRQSKELIKEMKYYPKIAYFKRTLENGSQVDDYELMKAKEILTTNYYDHYGLTNEEKAELLELIIKLEETL